MLDSGNRVLHTGPQCAKRVEQNDTAMAQLNKRRKAQKRKANIEEQYKMLSQSQEDKQSDSHEAESNTSDQEETDSNTRRVRTTTKDKLKAGSTRGEKSSTQATVRKSASAMSSSGTRKNVGADDESLKPELIAKIAARDHRTDHFNFLLKKLRTIWENGAIPLTTMETSAQVDSKRSEVEDELQDLGTIDAHNAGKAKVL